MRFYWILCFVGLFCLLFESQALARFAFVVRVQDDGLIAVSKWPNAEREDSLVRMYGVTMPSMHQPFGKEAIQYLLKYLPKGEKIEISPAGETDSDGIEDVLLQVGGHSLNYSLVEEGLAWVNRRTCKSSYCRRWYIVEHRAVQENKGVWSLQMETPPWQWAR
ncbi:MAG: thermonuclease family protein [Desulfovibrio sp.]|nr:thermonuclease family protein [Desulfovibrio sp.]